ncbi:MAG: hypothetical protein Q8R92_13625 [Deltaproteobacteria bacterium]|nr:hypothetical protein [Deltaproteobacteria bacterium]
MLKMVLPLLLVALLCSGCYTVRHKYSGPVTITNAKEVEGKPHIVKHFKKHDRQVFWLFGLAGSGEPLNVLKLAAEEARPDQAIVNFRLKDGMSTGDAFLDGLIGIVGTYSVWIEGDVVQGDTVESVAPQGPEGERMAP